MWKLTIERTHDVEIDGKKYESNHTVHCESECLGELVSVVEGFRHLGTDGEYHYIIESVEVKGA